MGPSLRSVLRRVARDLLVNGVLASPLVIAKLRLVVMRGLGFDLADGVRIEPNCWFSSAEVSIGRDSFLNYGCFIESSASVRIGAGCDLGMQVMLCSITHAPGTPSRRAGQWITRPIAIGDGCWLGARVTVLPGVTIGDGCVIAAGATVVRDCEPHGLYGGVPAVRLRDLPPGAPGAAPPPSHVGPEATSRILWAPSQALRDAAAAGADPGLSDDLATLRDDPIDEP